MIKSIFSLLLLVLPGYSLFNIKLINKEISLNKMDKFLFGFIIWIFYIVSTVLLSNIIFPNYLTYVFFFNYLLGFILVGYWFFKEIRRILNNFSRTHHYQIKINLRNITLSGTLPFIFSMIIFIVIITLYTPIIYQYDALGSYLIEGRKLVEDSSSLTEKGSTFGASMPVMPIIYSWFFYLSNTPILRLIPLTFFFLTILITYKLGRKLSPENPHAAYISVVSLISTTALQWYMAKTSLYLDLCLMFFTAFSIYVLMIVLEDESKGVNFIVLSINLALLLLSKEYGIFYTWFIIGFLVFLRCKKIFKNLYCSLFHSLFLIMPFSLRMFSYLMLYSFTKKTYITPSNVFKFFIIILFLILNILVIIRVEIKYIKLNLSTLVIAIIPLIFPALFFINNFFSWGTPFGTYKESYIESLYETGIIFVGSAAPNISYFNIPNIFLCICLLAMNFLPLLFFSLRLLAPLIHKIQDKHTELLSSWFLYSLLLFFYVTSGYIKGGHIRRILILVIPVALIVGKGIHYLLNHYSIPYYIGNLIYICSISIFQGYLWFLKVDVKKWWLINLNFLINDIIYAQFMEVILYSSPWLVLLIFIRLTKNNLILSKIHSNKFWAKINILIMLISTITPTMMIIQAIKYPKTWNPSYYDEADSVKSYSNHWHIPIIEYYRSQLNYDTSITIGFGVNTIQYFLERPFIDLNHPRNWVTYLPLFQEISTKELLSYLESLNARYFLIPTENMGNRDRYEAALKTSTLFILIESSEVFTGSEGQMYKFEKLAEFSPLVLYVLTQYSNQIPIDMEVAE